MDQAPSTSRQCFAAADETVEVLQLVLQQLAPNGCDIRTLCSLLQVSTTCRAAVYESGVSCSVTPTDLGCSQECHPSDLQRLSGFAAFLPGNAGLVSSLELCAPSSETDHALSEHLLTLAVQLCAQQQATASATAAAVQSWTPSGLARPLHGLQLRSYTGDLLLQPAALAALGACSQLTSLEWQLASQELPAAATVRSLRHLSALESMTVAALPFSDSCSAAMAQALGQLQHLTYLEVDGWLPTSALQHLPRSLVSLQVRVHIPEQQQAAVSLSHLSCLRDLSLGSYQQLSGQSAMPASLTHLTFSSKGGMQVIPDLPNLRVLHACVDFTQPSLLHHVSGLPVLQKLVLDLWRHSSVSRAVADSVAAHVARATQITCLQVYRNRFGPRRDGSDSDVSLSLLGSLRQLPRLRELTGLGLRLQADDLLGWTQLSALTSLELIDCRDVTDTAAAALACKLTGLQRRRLVACGLSSPVLWPAFAAGCSEMHELSLQGNPIAVSDATLLLLTSLRCLTSLELPDAVLTEAGPAPAVSAGAVRQFRAAMPQLRVLTGL